MIGIRHENNRHDKVIRRRTITLQGYHRSVIELQNDDEVVPFVVCRRDVLFYEEATGYVAHRSKVSYTVCG